jgi:hypothetical protein
MHVDRYTKAVLTLIAAALAALAAHAWVDRLAPSRAEAQTATPKHGEIHLPRAWGKIVHFSNGNLLMEASDGTLRMVDLDGKAPEYPKVKVQVRWQQ